MFKTITPKKKAVHVLVYVGLVPYVPHSRDIVLK